ncbi:hypothetical protein ABZ860_00405 [Microbispora sp. NPDC046973]|uniref:hypothetical protein n=1 Tax=Microbispora sp. NPDC046973 TaxID=3155022 RepID=UPI0034069802
MSGTRRRRERHEATPMTASSPTPAPDPGPTRPVVAPVLPAPGRERGVFREEALRRHAVRRREPGVPVVLRGSSFLLLWITVAVLAVAGVVVAVLVAEAAR